MQLSIFKPNFRHLIVGVEEKVPLKDGKTVTGINFDNAASTPPFTSVIKKVVEFAPWYSSIHRGTGYKSQISSDLYEKGREVVADFVKADLREKTVIFVKNTTDAINKLSYRLLDEYKKGVILSTEMEHHSNDLPWRKYKIDYVQVDYQGKLILEDLEQKLKKYRGKVKLVAVTGASNVTGFLNPIYTIASIAHKYGARILVDGAQLVPHTPVKMHNGNDSEELDFLAFSAHKMYAPFGTGVLIGPKEVFQKGSPEYVGGGTVAMVTRDIIIWDEPPFREEAGSPNVIGVVALQEAIKTLQSIGMENIDKHERSLTEYALRKLRKIPDIQLYGNHRDSSDRVGIIPFNIRGMTHEAVAKILAFEGGIAVRNGCFCAQPYVQKLLKVNKKDIEKHLQNPKAPHPGLVRLSFGLYNDYQEVDKLIQLLTKIVENKAEYIRKYQRV